MNEFQDGVFYAEEFLENGGCVGDAGSYARKFGWNDEIRNGFANRIADEGWCRCDACERAREAI